MKTKIFYWAIHIIVLMLLLVIPYASTDQLINALDPSLEKSYLGLCLQISFILIVFFYLNYIVLIPRFLIKKKHWQYTSLLLLSIFLTFTLTGSVFFNHTFHQTTVLNSKKVNEIIFPIIVINTLSIWLLSIFASIIGTIYTRLREAENEKMSAQIASLKSQINPHFLFNTLNNIYSMSIDTLPKTADMIDKLSAMMRYTMKNNQEDLVMLEDEINYVINFIELQKIRLDKSVMIDFEVDTSIPKLQIAPMIMIPFIENAFKHGIDYEQNSHIKITISIKNTALNLIVKNNKNNLQISTSKKSGLGIMNTKKRLNLMYPNRHNLSIMETETIFSVNLQIQLQ